MKKYFSPLIFALIALASCTGNYQKTEDGIIFKKDNTNLKLTVCTDKIIRVEYAPPDSFPGRKSLIARDHWTPVDFTTRRDGQQIIVATHSLTATLNIETGNITFAGKSGKKLLSEQHRQLTTDTVMGEHIFHLLQSWKLTGDEALYGLGQLQNGRSNLRNSVDTLIQTNTVAVNPFLVSTHGYGILWDNYSKTVFRDDETGASFWSEVGDKIDYYFVAGENMDSVISGYRKITGRAPMFGKWAFGYWQSKERYVDAGDLMSVVKKYRRLKIPIDNIVQDWNYWGDITDKDSVWVNAKKNWSSMSFHPSTYPDPEATIRTVHQKYKMHFMISVWPALGPQTAIYKEMKAKGLLYPARHWSSGYLYDAFNKEARDIYWKYIKSGLMDKGVDALWMDGTEPELGDQHTFKVSETNIKKFGRTALGTFARYLNAYSLMTTTGVYNHWRHDFPDKRVFILTRSAFAGQQRNAAVTWSGDVNANWQVFREQITAGINFCMAGIPYWTTDIGAFFLHGHDHGHGPGMYEGCDQDAYREFYVRWFQYGVFNPVFRSHGTHTPREVWRFGKKGEWAYDALIKYDNLRYRLLPYIYSLAWQVTHSDYTMMRGLAMDFTGDPETFDIRDQFMFGPALMICPVAREQYFPLDKTKEQGLSDVKSRSVYLPAGYDWYDFWTGEKIAGGKVISRETPIDIIPIYVRAGSIIPMGPYLQYATEKPEDPIELRIYTGADASFVIYEDENDNYNYEKGVYAEIPVTWNEQTQTLTIGARKGTFPGMLKNRTFHVVWIMKNHGTGVALEENSDMAVKYTGETITVKK